MLNKNRGFEGQKLSVFGRIVKKLIQGIDRNHFMVVSKANRRVLINHLQKTTSLLAGLEQIPP
jgi:hypothetical protein